MIPNWDLAAPWVVVVAGARPGGTTDAISGRDLGKLEEGISLEVPPAGWRVIRVAR